MSISIHKHSIRHMALMVILIVLHLNLLAQENDQKEIMIWPGDAPGSEGLNLKEKVDERSPDPTQYHNRIISGVDHPTITPFIPENPNGTAVLICPGGGYTIMAFDKEGIEIAQWLNGLGVTAFVLKYRLPAEGHKDRKDVPLQDVQRAMRTIRYEAEKWDIDPDKIGVMGFSAGGHLASSLGVLYDKKVYSPIDKIDDTNARPDFMILDYPVISMKTGITHEGSRTKLLGKSPSDELIEEYSTNLHIDHNTPPTFLVLAHDDKAVIPQNSLLFYEGLLNSGVNASLHIFQHGGHGFGIRGAKGPVFKWTELCEAWLRTNSYIPD